MKSDISEFSYGFALTSELIHTFKLSAFGAPFFINQYKEGKSGGGFDMKLPGVPVFFQFKVSDVLTTANAANSGKLGLPYYRFGIRSRKHSDQHQLLLDLESKGNHVYYAAPIFRYPDELDSYFSTKAVIQNSAFVAPRSIGVIANDDPHTVSFTTKHRFAIFRSEPRQIELADIQHVLPKLRGEDLGSEKRTRRDLIEDLVTIYRSREITVSPDREQFLRQGRDNIASLEHISYLARNLFGVEILYVDNAN